MGYASSVTQRQSLVILLAQTVIVIVALVAATVLCGMGRLDSASVMAIFGAAIGLTGPSTVSLGSQMINGGPKPDYAQLARSSPEAAVALATAAPSPTQPNSGH